MSPLARALLGFAALVGAATFVLPVALFGALSFGSATEPALPVGGSTSVGGCFSALPSEPQAGLPGLVAGLDAAQVHNVKVIVGEAERRGLPDYAVVIAVATARQESVLRNLPGGHGTSVGLFQLIDDHGSFEERIDPLFSTRWFFDGLQGVPGWQAMPLTVAAQTVQRSAYPNAYAQWEGLARQVVQAVTGARPEGGGTPCGVPVTGTECPANEASATWERGLVTDAVRLSRCLYQAFGADPLLGGLGGWAPGRGHVRGSAHYTGRAVDLGVRRWETGEGLPLGDAIATWAVANADVFGVKTVIWNERIWSAGTGQWKAYRHPCGCSDPNLQHRNHVHVDVFGVAV